jgi:hypothetical protein
MTRPNNIGNGLLDIGKRLRKARRISSGNASIKRRLGDQRRLPPLNSIRAFEAAARSGDCEKIVAFRNWALDEIAFGR